MQSNEHRPSCSGRGTIDGLIKMKRELGREKDLADIALITGEGKAL